MLSIQSFYRNQSILDALNRLLVYLKLQGKGVDSRISEAEVRQSKEDVISFLHRLNVLVGSIEKKPLEPLIGADERMRSFAKNFVAAKRRNTRFKSLLFKRDISQLEKMLLDLKAPDRLKVIESLSELGTLLEEQTSSYLKEIVGEI